jgi:hypothetical protein
LTIGIMLIAGAMNEKQNRIATSAQASIARTTVVPVGKGARVAANDAIATATPR